MRMAPLLRAAASTIALMALVGGFALTANAACDTKTAQMSAGSSGNPNIPAGAGSQREATIPAGAASDRQASIPAGAGSNREPNIPAGAAADRQKSAMASEDCK
jgi:hypothetical protein